MLTVEQALALRKGKKLACTNGVFDILHIGHVRYLTEARKQGDLLLVGMNTDASVKRLGKGDDRPHHPLEERAEVLEALRCVDGVVAFDEDTPEALIALLKPEIPVKGGDYHPKPLPEAELVKSYGGEIVLITLTEGRSTSAIVERIRAYDSL